MPRAVDLENLSAATLDRAGEWLNSGRDHDEIDEAMLSLTGLSAEELTAYIDAATEQSLALMVSSVPMVGIPRAMLAACRSGYRAGVIATLRALTIEEEA